MPDPTPSEDLHTPEVQQASSRGLYTQSHKLLFESPSPEVIMSFQKADPRITYFHYRVPDLLSGEEIPEVGSPKWKTPEESHVTFSVPDDDFKSLNAINSQGIPRNLFDFLVRSHLEQYLAEKYRDREIAVRGTACSVRTGMSFANDYKLNDPIQILERGVEHNEGEIAPMIGFNPDKPEIPFRSYQWLIEHPGQLRKDAQKQGKVDLEKSIFPVLLVYDRSKFRSGSSELPKDPIERSKCILEAIVLDYPLSREEFKVK